MSLTQTVSLRAGAPRSTTVITFGVLAAALLLASCSGTSATTTGASIAPTIPLHRECPRCRVAARSRRAASRRRRAAYRLTPSRPAKQLPRPTRQPLATRARPKPRVRRPEATSPTTRSS